MLSRKRVVSVAVGLLLGLPMGVRAEILTWAMEGTIETVNDPLGLIGFAQVGGHVEYTFTFDTNTPDTNPTPTLAFYSVDAATFSVDGTAIATGISGIDIQRFPTDHTNDMFNVDSQLDTAGVGGLVYFRLLDPLGTGLTSTDLPLEPYDLGAFASSRFSCTIADPRAYPNFPGFWGQIDSLYAIPEPVSLALFVVAAWVVGIRRVR